MHIYFCDLNVIIILGINPSSETFCGDYHSICNDIDGANGAQQISDL